MRILESLLSLFALCATGILGAHGKIDVGPVYANIKVLESGQTVEDLDMWGVRGDGTIQVWKALCVKPMVTYIEGDARFFATSLAAGVFLPLSDRLSIFPNAGVGYTYLKSNIDKPLLGLSDLDERFRSVAPSLGIDATFQVTPCIQLSGTYQYSWPRTVTILHSPLFGQILNAKSSSRGPVYAAEVDYFLNDNWSVNLSGGYNLSFTKEKHGFKGKGVRLGIGYRW